jgi:hypothetical protein
VKASPHLQRCRYSPEDKHTKGSGARRVARARKLASSECSSSIHLEEDSLQEARQGQRKKMAPRFYENRKKNPPEAMFIAFRCMNTRGSGKG